MNQIYFNFYGQKVCVSTEWAELSNLLRKDFSVFTVSQINPDNSSKILNLTIVQGLPSDVKIPEMISKMQTLNSITYQQGSIRYNDYYGKLLSIFDYKNESAQIISNDMDKTHEVAYLLILSRIGKRLDEQGLHKLHAFAISYKNMAFVCMMPMKGGKSTLLLELLKHNGVKMISDDIPLIDKRGNIHPFPIKIGMENESNHGLNITNQKENIYFLKREQYGIKTFICLDGLENKIEKPGKIFEKVIIAEAFRFNSDFSEIKNSSWTSTFKGLFKHGIIGIGLPMIVEYFWEFGIKDFSVKTKIFFYRLYAFFIFSMKSKRIKIQLGKRSDLTATLILKFLEGQLEGQQ